MYEHCRGTDSFWEPFLAMLPMPGSVSEWTDDEMITKIEACLTDATMQAKLADISKHMQSCEGPVKAAKLLVGLL